MLIEEALKVSLLVFVFFFNIYLFLLCQVLAAAHGSSIFVAAHGILTCNMWDLAPWPEMELRSPDGEDRV